MTSHNGGEWCYEHQRYEPLNDQIDYPVSDTFLASPLKVDVHHIDFMPFAPDLNAWLGESDLQLGVFPWG